MSRILATGFEELQEAKTIATLAVAAYEADKEDGELATAQCTASVVYERKKLEVESAREAFDTAVLALDNAYIDRQPDSKIAVAILKKRVATATQEVKRLRLAHISCQKAVERAMQRRHVEPEVFKHLRAEEVKAKDALDKAIQDQSAVSAA